MKIFDKILYANRYYKMSDVELEMEGKKWNVSGGLSNGNLDRQFVVNELLQRHQANEARVAILISMIALVVSLISIFCN